MSIIIDRDPILERFTTSMSGKRSRFESNSISLGQEVLELSQIWFDDEPWKCGDFEHFGCKRSCRIELLNYCTSNLNLKDKSKSYFVPSFVWTWVANQVITIIVKMVIDHYWHEMDTPTA